MLSDHDRGLWGVSELCRRYGVSRETFYVWKNRRLTGGISISSYSPINSRSASAVTAPPHSSQCVGR
jgi:transposase-like protein